MKNRSYLPLGEVAFIAFLFSISSCSPPHYMYSPTAVNVPAFTRKGESSLGASASAHGFDGQAAYAVGNHIALLGNWYWRREWQYNDYWRGPSPHTKEFDTLHYKRSSLGFGAVYFGSIDSRQRFFASVSGGYGWGHMGMAQYKVRRYPDADTSLSRDFYQFHSDVNRMYLQYALMGHFQVIKIIFSMRFSGVIYRHVQSTYGPEIVDVNENKLYVFIEPTATYYYTSAKTNWLSFRMQMGLSIPPHNANFDTHSIIGNLGVSIDPVKLLHRGADKKE